MSQATIRQLNDLHRAHIGLTGTTHMTAGVNALPRSLQSRIFNAVRTFDAFTADNDPHGEHDFGSFEIKGKTVFFKIAYYDKTMEAGSEDPADPDQTVRVLTIMLAEEY